MGKRSRLLSALDAQLEKNHEVEQQKSLQRKAASRRKNNDLAHKPSLDDPDDNEIAAAGGEVVSQNRKTKSTTQVGTIGLIAIVAFNDLHSGISDEADA